MNDSEYYLVSVIVPVYNSINWLRRCVDSLIKQELTSIEILLIDDGSTDGSSELCDNYADKYKNIYVMHKENGGVTSARILGLERAHGDYIGFVDADDWVEPGMYSVMYHHAKEYRADVVICRVFDGESSKKSVRTTRINSNTKSGCYGIRGLREKIFPFLLQEQGHSEQFGITPFLCDKLFKREILLKNVKYVNPHVHWGEDQLLTYPAILSSDCIYIEPNYFYHYAENLDSATHKYRKGFLESAQSFFVSLDRIVEGKKKIYDLSRQVHTTKIMTCIQVVNNEINYPEEGILHLYKRIKSIIDSHMVSQVFSEKIEADFTVKTRIYCFLIKGKHILLIICLKKLWNIIKQMKKGS